MSTSRPAAIFPVGASPAIHMRQPLTLPNLAPLAASLDLDRFYAKLQDHNQARPLTVEEAGRAILEYRQFLTLRREHPAL